MSQKSPQTLAYFDAVRAISSQLVVMGHAAVLCFASLRITLPNGKEGAIPGDFHIQSYSVVAFLVLSGFLITFSTKRKLAKKKYSLKVFFVDRATRILTPLLPLIPVVLLFDAAFLGEDGSKFVVAKHDWHTIIWNLLLLQDNAWFTLADRALGTDISARSLGSAAPWWTVAYEWWIYLLFGATIALFVSRQTWLGRALCLALIVFAAGSVFGRLAAGNGLVVAWAAGAVAAAYHDRISQLNSFVPRAATLIAWSASLAGILMGVGVYHPALALTTGLAITSLFYALPTVPAPKFLKQLNVVAADYSYSLYLVHFSVMIWFAALLPNFQGTVAWLCMVLLGNILSAAWWYLTERNHKSVNGWIKTRLSLNGADRKSRVYIGEKAVFPATPVPVDPAKIAQESEPKFRDQSDRAPGSL